MGKFIVIDGIDGAGKSTQTPLLVEGLKERGLTVGQIPFPGYEQTFSGKLIAQYLRGELGNLYDTDPYMVSYLFAVDRFEQQEKLKHLLTTHDIVIATRYVISNIAYQAAKLDQSKRSSFRTWCAALDYKVLGNPQEDMILFLDLPIDFSRQLVAKRESGSQKRDIHEEDSKYLNDVYNEYKILASELKHCFTIKAYQGHHQRLALKDPQKIHEEMIKVVLDKIFLKGQLINQSLSITQ